ncbi:MAG: multiple sugar transport system substrate-binding protein [Clostridiales bacterium]|jgi:ABC-type glycerol-3-phosphate transport system substrate-binding protein|nr:multiple sugar transport system substrate-binding protein [Clostridiales bacterium]MDN5283568.1 multiple sugar transport system substrate-binding protein [Candidatus Ozemobacter sp.]
MRNFLIGVLIVWIIIIGLIMQHNKETAGGGTTESIEGRVRIVFWHAMGGPLGKVMDDLVNRYNNSQKDYFIKSINMGSYDTLAKKVLASLVAEEAPDISQNYETLTKKFIKHKKIVCLDDLIASETEDIKGDIIPVLLENNTFDGKLYSFPFNKSVPVLYYNKDMFRKVGLDPDRGPATLDELASYARQITEFHKNTGDEKDAGVYGYGCSKANVWSFLNRILQFGGKIVTEDAKRSYFDEEPAINALAFLQGMLREKIAIEGQGFDHQNDFIAGKCGIIESSIVSKVFMENSIDFDFGVAPLPKQVKKGVILSGSNINIFNNGDPKKIAGAWDFVKWFTSTEIGAEWSIRTTYMPVRKSSLQSEYFQKAQQKDPNLKAPYVQLEYCEFEPRLTCWFEVRDLMADHLERATLEMGPAEKYCKEMADDVNAILKHNTD